MAAASGYTVLSARPRRARDTFSARFAPRYPLVLFSLELLALLRAGLSLVESLETLAEKEQHASFSAVLASVNASLHEGQSFSAALERHPQAFPPLYVSTVRASEHTGNLAESLSRYVAYRIQMEGVRKKMISASIYPFVLIAVGGIVTLFLLGYVVPRFSQIYADMGGNLPLLSRLLLQWGNLLARHGMAVGAVAAVGTLACVYLLSLPSTRAALLQCLWRVPAIGERMKIYQFARFYRTLGMLLRGGTPLVKAIAMSAQLLHAGLRDQLEAARTAIQDGGPIAQSFERNGLTTRVALRMLRVGERSGSIAEMMERIAEFHDEEVARWVDWFTKLVEPLLMALIGIAIGVIVVLMYMPIFELAGGLQ